MADTFSHFFNVQLPAELDQLLGTGKLGALYQSIVSLRSGGLLGWEACVRGPRESYFHRPAECFSFAEAKGLVPPLEKACWHAALRHAGELRPEQKLFLNLHPRTVMEAGFLPGIALETVARAGLKPQKIVIEITERDQISDFPAFMKAILECRRRGFLVAIDDVGSGFANLQAIAEIMPDFIKLDISLVKAIHSNRAKSALIETLVMFADKIGSAIVAEGIETEKDLFALINLGVHCGQGFFLDAPAYPKRIPTDDILIKIAQSARKVRWRLWNYAFLLGDIIEKAATVAPTDKVETVKLLLDEDESLTAVVVEDAERPLGLVMRQHLDRSLAKRHGVEIYYNKPISTLMDDSPLTLEESVPVEMALQLAMNREKLNRYDHIIVTKGQQLRGLLSVQLLFEVTNKTYIETARAANPLTGLPGNMVIEEQLVRRSTGGSPFSILFVDLDHFKSYNDKYGFEKGDNVILFTAKLLENIIHKYGTSQDFLGHIGGDDFFILTETICAEELCRRVIRYFDRLIKSHYGPEERAAGGILGHDREGNERWFPFISVSMVLLDVMDASFDPKRILEKLAQLKQYVKSLPGSGYVRDRRGN